MWIWEAAYIVLLRKIHLHPHVNPFNEFNLIDDGNIRYDKISIPSHHRRDIFISYWYSKERGRELMDKWVSEWIDAQKWKHRLYILSRLIFNVKKKECKRKRCKELRKKGKKMKMSGGIKRFFLANFSLSSFC